MAERLFARNGYAGTSVRDITAAAGCNLAAVSYHFGGKVGLYRDMFRRRLASRRRQRIASLRLASGAGRGPVRLETLLTTFANAFLEPLVEESRGRLLMALWAREALDPTLPPDLFDEEIVGPVQQALVDAMRSATPRLSRARARLCARSIVGQLLDAARHAHRGEPTGAARTRRDRSPTSETVHHIVRFSAGGIRACAGVPP